MPDPIPNIPLLEKIFDHIVANPEEWCQASYVATRLFSTDASTDMYFEKHKVWEGTERICATAFCVAGHAAFMTGSTPIWDNHDVAFQISSMRMPNGDVRNVDDIAQEVLGLKGDEAVALFNGGNSLGDIRRHIDKIKERAQ